MYNDRVQLNFGFDFFSKHKNKQIVNLDTNYVISLNKVGLEFVFVLICSRVGTYVCIPMGDFNLLYFVWLKNDRK